MTRPTHLIFAAALALAAAAAPAQTVYRCGSSYAQQPCPGGVAVPASDLRTPAEAARAGSVATADAKRADALEKARLAQEKNAPRAVIIGAKAPAAGEGKAAKDGPRAGTGKLEQFTAIAPRKAGEAKKPKAKKSSKPAK